MQFQVGLTKCITFVHFYSITALLLLFIIREAEYPRLMVVPP